MIMANQVSFIQEASQRCDHHLVIVLLLGLLVLNPGLAIVSLCLVLVFAGLGDRLLSGVCCCGCLAVLGLCFLGLHFLGLRFLGLRFLGLRFFSSSSFFSAHACLGSQHHAVLTCNALLSKLRHLL